MLEIKNLQAEVNRVEQLFEYMEIARLNGNVLRVAQVEQRTMPFHVHAQSDELFCVLEGSFELETDDGLQTLRAGELVIVPRGVRHRPVVTSLVKVLLAELDGTLTRENSGELK